MDFVHARGCGAVAVAAFMMACSSSSSTAGNTPGNGHVSMEQDSGADSSTGGGGDYDAATDYDAAISACKPYTTSTLRVACCQQAIPRGYLAIQVAEEDCLCGASGPCLGACNYQDCQSVKGSTDTCTSCLDINLIGSCKSPVDSACSADTACVAYRACLAAMGP